MNKFYPPGATTDGLYGLRCPKCGLRQCDHEPEEENLQERREGEIGEEKMEQQRGGE